MTAVNLKSLLITNFRSLRGTVAIPLDAPVILLHGLNGTGKTSVLSAIELALTGQIAHLHRVDKDYERHLLHQDTDSGSVAIFSRGDDRWSGPNEATITLTREGGSGPPLLGDEDAKFFSERCYLPQSTLGRLLELYQDANTNEKTSPLTQFVKDLLGLDQLDALVEGLNPAFHVARIRNLVPEYRRYESLVASLRQEVDSERANFVSLLKTISVERAEIEQLFIGVYDDKTLLGQLHTNPRALIKAIEEDSTDTTELSVLTSARQELEVYEERFAALPKDVASAERNAQEKEHVETKNRLNQWTANDGKRLSDLIASLNDLFPDLPSPLTSSPTRAHNITESRVIAEKERCERVLADNQTSVARLKVLDSEIQQSLQKISETENELKQLSEHADALARALAGLIPYVHDEDCPVCRRDFRELEQGPLSARLSATIASLTSESGRLKFLTNSRVEESNRARINNQERRRIQSSLIPVADVSNLSLRVATLTEALSKLGSLRNATLAGEELMRREALLADNVAQARRRNQDEALLAARVEKVREDLSRYFPDKPSSLADLLTGLIQTITAHIEQLRKREERRRLIVRRIATYIDKLDQADRHRVTKETAEQRMLELNTASIGVDRIREAGKTLANAARHARTNIVGRVFNTALNKVWRDLFVRLAPQEKFVPAFKLASSSDEPIEAGLETVHRSGEKGGPPGTMLSAGNLNTAALTLFLALHLSVKNRLPWIILDDPVQSMDDVHISQFAALLRTFAKSLDRQIIIAVHDRALFDYLALELSPAFQDDRLITVELSRTLAGESVGNPKVITFAPDDAIAA